MISVWIKTAGIIFAIAIGYVIKKTGFLPENAAKILSKLMINVLLPFVYICNLNGNTLSGGMLSAFFWGLGVNILLTIAAVLLSHGKPKDSVFVLQYCVPGFNVSGFAIPVAQLFCSDREVAALIMFNVSITFFFFIVTPTLIHMMSPGEKRVRLKDIANDLSHNIPAMVSVIMVLLCLLHIALPEPVITAFRPLANANSAIALISLGMLFEFPKSFPKENIIALSVRLLITLSAAALAWSGIMPFGELKNVMIIVMLAPIPSASPAMALTQGYEGSHIAFGVSANLLYSVVAMTIVCGMLF